MRQANIPIDELLSDRFCDFLLDELIVANGGQRGFTDERINLARWDMRRCLQDTLIRVGVSEVREFRDYKGMRPPL